MNSKLPNLQDCKVLQIKWIGKGDHLKLHTGEGLIQDSLGGGTLGLGLITAICCLQAALSEASGALQILSCLQQGQVRGQDSWPAHEVSGSCFLDGCQGLHSRYVLVDLVASTIAG